uniref:Uncharacterized protein n=1 Tax=Anguilla anguilla TaxID=7936 RepID=A0A0E9SLJ2_ANGAN
MPPRYVLKGRGTATHII